LTGCLAPVKNINGVRGKEGFRKTDLKRRRDKRLWGKSIYG
jgi:hypothetical protein